MEHRHTHTTDTVTILSLNRTLSQSEWTPGSISKDNLKNTKITLWKVEFFSNLNKKFGTEEKKMVFVSIMKVKHTYNILITYVLGNI